jgi:predicted Fe-Mo cluster-binding NifX family protein
MKIGITSQNFRTITGHAGKTRRFLIYTADPDNGTVSESGHLDLPKEMSLHAYNAPQPHPVEQLDILITAGCGEGFRQRMARSNVYVVVTDETDPETAARAAIKNTS